LLHSWYLAIATAKKKREEGREEGKSKNEKREREKQRSDVPFAV